VAKNRGCSCSAPPPRQLLPNYAEPHEVIACSLEDYKMSVQRRITIFLSSPTDVQPEREAAERIVARLGGVYSSYISPSLDRWERQFYEATRGFQESIAAMDTFELVVGIVWKRIGSELPPQKFRRDDGSAFESGTVYEIESALAANRRSKKPSVYVFRKTAAVMFTEAGVEQERQQKQSLDAWWARTFRDSGGHYVAATNEFSTIEEFETKFENFLVDWFQQRKYIPSGPVWDVPTRGSPYPGLIAYDRDRTPVFFGRQLAIGQARDEFLAASKRDGGMSALFVIGASGSGKSSLVRAGLLPLLIAPGTIPGIDLLRSTVTQPTGDSLTTMAECVYTALPELATGAQPAAAKWARVAAESPEAAADALAWALDRVGEAERRRTGADHDLKAALILLVDQLENLFGSDGQKPFSRALRGLVASGRVWLLTTMRSDRYADLQVDPELLTLKRNGATYDLPPPGPAEITDIVKGPARAAGLTFAERDGRSLARVLSEAVPNADALPLLQMTLSQLFERRDGETLGFGAYDAIGGIEGAIAAHADTVFASASAAVRRELDPLLRMLVSDVSRRGDRTIRFIARAADRKSFETSVPRKDLIKLLVEGRLLVSDGASMRVAHEALLRRWDRAKQSVERIADAELRKARLRTVVAVAAAFVFLAIGVYAWSQQNAAIKQTQLAQAEAQGAAANLLAARARQASTQSPQLGASSSSPATRR
jgi:eukaryotic-like serine/threonine-protein kinase